MRPIILAALVLSGCASLVPSTLIRANNLSPMTADPAVIAVDLTLPAGVDVSPGTAQLFFGFRRDDTGESQSAAFVLERAGSVFRLSPDDVVALRALQATAAEWKAANDDKIDGTLSLALAPCLRGDGPAQDARVSVAIRFEEGGAFLPLVRNGPLSAVASTDEIRDMGACS